MALVIGHRGARALAPENSLEGIRAAAKSGADLVELDVRLSADGALILMHDETVDRTTSGKGRVEDLSLQDLLALELDGQRIPTLKEAVSLAGEMGLGVVVEMKEEGCEELVAQALLGCSAMVTSFFHASLALIKEICPIKTGIIISSLPVKPVELALLVGADAIFPKRTNPNLFKEAHRFGLEVYPWTINRESEASWLLRLGADGLVTDDPAFIRTVVDMPVRSTGKNNCEYYPCHNFPEQDCTHCFCPLYPCKDTDLGRYVTTKRGKRVWSCIDCHLVHLPQVSRYLASNPQATTHEMKLLKKELTRGLGGDKASP
jgi:glycerophosphoryl diester phosphodiesterase